MTETVARIKEQIDALSADERNELIDSLLESEEMIYQLGGPSGKWLTEDEFNAELKRRDEEMQSGKVKGIPAEEVFAELRKKYQ